MEVRILEEHSVEVRLSKVEAEVKDFLSTQETLKRSTTLAQRNQERRRLYMKNECIHLDIEEALLKNFEASTDGGATASFSDDLSTSKDPNLAEAIKRMYAIREQLTLEIQPESKSPMMKAYMVFRLASFVVFFFGAFFIFFFLIPLRWLHPTLRRMGVKNNYLPIDFIQWSFGWLLCTCAGIQILTEGTENVRSMKDSTVMMFTYVIAVFVYYSVVCVSLCSVAMS